LTVGEGVAARIAEDEVHRGQVAVADQDVVSSPRPSRSTCTGRSSVALPLQFQSRGGPPVS
jgi:hypothetical protein